MILHSSAFGSLPGETVDDGTAGLLTLLALAGRDEQLEAITVDETWELDGRVDSAARRVAAAAAAALALASVSGSERPSRASRRSA